MKITVQKRPLTQLDVKKSNFRSGNEEVIIKKFRFNNYITTEIN